MEKLFIKVSDRISVEIEGNSTKELIRKAAFWSAVPNACPICDAPLILTQRTTSEGHEYFGLKCIGVPPHSANFGEYKDQNKGLYYKTPEENYWSEGIFGQAQEGASNPGLDPSQAPLDIPADPIAKSLSDMITTKQLGMIRALGRENGIDVDAECEGLMKCKVSELSRRAASALIDRLQGKRTGAHEVTAGGGGGVSTVSNFDDDIPF
jgi:hypothetical protein